MKKALVVALLGVGSLFSLPAHATVTDLYNNLSEGNTIDQGIANASGGPLADSFSTGSTSFDLTQVQLVLDLPTNTGKSKLQGYTTIQLFSDNGNSTAPAPVNVLATIGTIVDKNLTTSPTIESFTISGITLAANTRYWIEASASISTGPTTFDGLANWVYTTNNNPAGEWNLYSGDVFPNSSGPYLMSVSGTAIASAVPEPEMDTLFAIGLVGLGLARCKAKFA